MLENGEEKSFCVWTTLLIKTQIPPLEFSEAVYWLNNGISISFCRSDCHLKSIDYFFAYLFACLIYIPYFNRFPEQFPRS